MTSLNRPYDIPYRIHTDLLSTLKHDKLNCAFLAPSESSQKLPALKFHAQNGDHFKNATPTRDGRAHRTPVRCTLKNTLLEMRVLSPTRSTYIHFYPTDAFGNVTLYSLSETSKSAFSLAPTH